MTTELLKILISWAALLSGYPAPDSAVSVDYVPHSWFVETMCGGKECMVIAGYLDARAPDTLYVDDRFIDDRSLYAMSFVVHEAVHMLQYRSGEFDSKNCDDSLQRERQAYYVQNEFLIKNGSWPILHMSHGRCAK